MLKFTLHNPLRDRCDMKFMAFIFAIATVAVLGGFTFVAFQKVPIEQTEIVKTVPNEKFLASDTQ